MALVTFSFGSVFGMVMVALVIDGYAAIFFLDARGCKLHRVGFLTLLDTGFALFRHFNFAAEY